MDQKTIDAYNELAETYDEETTDFWNIFPRTFLDKFIGSVKGKVLDVGSGPGRDGLILKNNGLEVTCIDASKAMVKISSERGLDSMVGDFMKMPFTGKSFDGVWAYTSLLHIERRHIDKALAEIVRVLKDGGVLGLGLVEGDWEGYRESSDVKMPRWFCYYKKEEIEDILKRHGFHVEYFESFKPKSKNYLNFVARKIQ